MMQETPGFMTSSQQCCSDMTTLQRDAKSGNCSACFTCNIWHLTISLRHIEDARSLCSDVCVRICPVAFKEVLDVTCVMLRGEVDHLIKAACVQLDGVALLPGIGTMAHHPSWHLKPLDC